MKKIIDTILYYDEVLILDLRLNILNKYIDHFVILECNYDFNGAYKGYNFDIQNFIKFKDKIIYIKLDLSKEIHLVKNNGWFVHDRSRDAIINSLEFVKDEDIIIHSDADEIPNLENFNFYDLGIFSKFSLILFMMIGRVELLSILIILKKFFFKS